MGSGNGSGDFDSKGAGVAPASLAIGGGLPAHNLSHKRELSLEGFESRSFLFDFVYIFLVLGFGYLGRFSGEGSL